MNKEVMKLTVRLLLVALLTVFVSAQEATAQKKGSKYSNKVITRLDNATNFLSLPPSEERRIGKEMDAKIKKSYKVSTNNRLNSYVKIVGTKLANKAGLGSDIKFTTLDDSKTINAFAIPGGYIYITTGMIKLLSNESELAAVLGHEIGHITENHIHARLRNALGTKVVFSLFGKLIGKDLSSSRIASASQYVIMQKFSRKHEYSADIAGLHLMVLAGYNPKGIVALQDKLYKLSKGKINVEFMASHPSSAKRRDKISQYISENKLGKPGQIKTTVKARTIK